MTLNQAIMELVVISEHRLMPTILRERLKGIIDAMSEWDEPEKEADRWILCSERLPEEKDAGILKKLGTQKRSDSVIVTVDVKGERMTDLGYTHDGVWQWKMKYAFPDYKVIAWKPLPEPYQEAEHDE